MAEELGTVVNAVHHTPDTTQTSIHEMATKGAEAMEELMIVQMG